MGGGWSSLLLVDPDCFIYSPLKKHLVSDLLIWRGSLFSFSFGFIRPLTNREATDVVFIRGE